MEVITISSKRFTIIISIYIIFSLYSLVFNFKTPLLGIETKYNNFEWEIINFEYKKWANLNNIKLGNIIVEVNHQPINTVTDKQDGFFSIRSANSLTIKDSSNNIRTIYVKQSDLINPFLFYFIFPLAYFLMSLILCLYIFIFKRENFKLLEPFVLFLLTVSVTYSSVGNSTKLDSIGTIITSNCLILSVIFLIHFVFEYFKFLNIDINNARFIKYSVVLYIFILLLTILELFQPLFYNFNTIFILFSFSSLIIYLLFILTRTYIKYRNSQIILMFVCLIAPLMPFLFLYALPELLLKQYILSSSLSALFLLIIPISLIYVQFPERLFDIPYHVSRFRYYSLISIVISLWCSIGIYFIALSSLNELILVFLVFLFLLSSILISLYLKEKIDFISRKVLYSPKGDYVHLIYSIIDRIGKVVNVTELMNRFKIELSKQLKINDIEIYTYSTDTQSILERNCISEIIHLSEIEKMKIGEIKKTNNIYMSCLHQTNKQKSILIIGATSDVYLKNEELLSLELLIIYMNNFIENTYILEGVINELNTSRKQSTYPKWLQKLIWMQLERDKFKLSQELHDTVLQEQIHLIRELDTIMCKKMDYEVRLDLKNIHISLIELNKNLRFYCDKMKPPLIDTLGLQAALQKLFLQINRRAQFSLISSIEPVEVSDEVALLIFRVIQEMLNNALKHSRATYVKLELTSIVGGLKLKYLDNGVGCDLKKILETESMGLRGIEQRVSDFEGIFYLDSNPNEGMQMEIIIKKGEHYD